MKKLKIVLYTMVSLFIISILFPLTNNVDYALKPYVDEVYEGIDEVCSEHRYIPKNYNILFADIKKVSPNVLGVCSFYGPSFTILIDRDNFYNYLTEDERFTLVAHEMLHCFLGERHVNDPGSIMNPYITQISKPLAKLDLYLTLIKRCQSQ